MFLSLFFFPLFVSQGGATEGAAGSRGGPWGRSNDRTGNEASQGPSMLVWVRACVYLLIY